MKRARENTTARTTLRQVAEATNVSPMTVSNVINGKLEFMTEQTRLRVEKAITRLNYRPHTTARSLRLAERWSVGMIIVDESPTYLADGFTTQVVAGLSNYLSDHRYSLVLEGVRAAKFKDSPLIRDLRTDGLCVMLSGEDEARQSHLKALLDLRQPLIVFLEPAPADGEEVCSIRQNDRSGGRLLGAHVLERGARRLAMLVQERNFWFPVREREKGIRDAIAKAATTAELKIVACGDGGFEDVQASLEHELEAHGVPDAILATNDQMGIAAMKLVKARGINVPDDILITGFNAFDFWRYSNPVLTTVRSAAYEMGRRSGEEMIRCLQQGAFSQGDIELPVELQVGGST
jgi:LacI family transcriptional regulator